MTEKHDHAAMTNAQQQASNQRAEMRHKVYVQITSVAGDKVDKQAISGNLSREGLFVATPTIVPVGTEIEVRFRLPNSDTHIVAVAEVAWTNGEKDFDDGKVPGYGVKFVELNDESQTELDAYMDHFEQAGHELS
jgi:uncharacterized protein (TIGR02266 family)